MSFIETNIVNCGDAVARNPDVREQLQSAVLPALQEADRLLVRLSEAQISADSQCSLCEDLFARHFVARRDALFEAVGEAVKHARRVDDNVTAFASEVFDSEHDDDAASKDRADLQEPARQTRLLALLVKARVKAGTFFESELKASLQHRLQLLCQPNAAKSGLDKTISPAEATARAAAKSRAIAVLPFHKLDLRRQLNEGGYGAVWEAEMPLWDDAVAVKLVKRSAEGKLSAAEREAQDRKVCDLVDVLSHACFRILTSSLTRSPSWSIFHRPSV